MPTVANVATLEPPQPAADAVTLADVLRELRELRADVRVLLLDRDDCRDAGLRRFLAAVDAQWGAGAPFGSGEILTWCADQNFASRRAVLDAIRELLELPKGAAATAHKLGLKLATLAGKRADGLELVRVDAQQRGARLWAVERVRG